MHTHSKYFPYTVEAVLLCGKKAIIGNCDDIIVLKRTHKLNAFSGERSERFNIIRTVLIYMHRGTKLLLVVNQHVF